MSAHGLTLHRAYRWDGGFPSNLKIWISYHLEESGAYEISYKVTTDQDTLVNPTNHSYFNLSGDFTQTVDRHVFQLNTEGIYPIAPDGVPAKTPDATRDVVKHIYNGALLKDIFAEEDEQIQLVSGLDHPFALPAGHDNAGFLYDQHSGRFLLFKTEALALWSTQQTLWMRVSSSEASQWCNTMGLPLKRKLYQMPFTVTSKPSHSQSRGNFHQQNSLRACCKIKKKSWFPALLSCLR